MFALLEAPKRISQPKGERRGAVLALCSFHFRDERSLLLFQLVQGAGGELLLGRLQLFSKPENAPSGALIA